MRGGAELHTIQLASALSLRGYQVTLICQIDDEEIEIYKKRNIDLSKVTFKRKRTNSKSPKIRTLVFEFLRYRPNIVLIPKGGIGSGSLIIEILSKLIRIPLIAIEHSTPITLPAPKNFKGIIIPTPFMLKLWFKFSIRSWFTSKNICVSYTQAEILIKSWKFNPNKIEVIHNFVDQKLFYSDCNRRSQARKLCKIPQSSFVYGMITRLEPVKQVEIAIKKFNQQDCTNSYLIIFGEGSEKKRLEGLLKEKNSMERIKLFDFTSTPWDIYPCFDYFLITSKTEGLPLSLLEAMASGCIPISADVGGIKEVIVNNNNGFLYQSNDMNELGHIIYKLSKMEPEKVQCLKKEANKTTSRFALENIMGRYEQLIKQLLH